MSKLKKSLLMAGLLGCIVAETSVLAVVPYQDNNRGPFRCIDDFNYADTTSGPFNNGWVAKVQGATAVCSSLAYINENGIPVFTASNSTGHRFAFFSGSQTFTCIAQYPPDTSEIRSKRRHFAFFVSAFPPGDSFAIEARVLVRWATDNTKYYYLRYQSGSGANFQLNDSTLVFRIGSGCVDGHPRAISRDFIADIKSFFPLKTLEYLSRICIYISENINFFGLGHLATFDRYPWIEGYASHSSIAQGGTINFHASTGDSMLDTAVVNASVDIYRFGATTEFVTTLSAQVRKRPLDSLIGATCAGPIANWPVTTSWNVPQSAKSGVYMARFKLTSNNKYTYCPFVVKEDSGGTKSKILFKISDNTWQAYNIWGGHSLNYNNAIFKIRYGRPYLEINQYCGHRTIFCNCNESYFGRHRLSSC